MHEESSGWETGTAQPSFDAAMRQIDLRMNHLYTPVLELDTLKEVHFGHVGTSLPALQSLIPQNVLPSQLRLLDFAIGDNVYSRDYFKLLVVGLTNNFSGLSGLPCHAILSFVISRFDQGQVSRALDLLHRPVSQALSEGLLRCAVYGKNAPVVDAILSQRDPPADVNSPIDDICNSDGTPRTLLDFAISSRALEVARILLEHNADVKRIVDGPKHSLRVPSRWYNSTIHASPGYLEFASMLMEKGTYISGGAILRVLEVHRELESVSNIIESMILNGPLDSWDSWERQAVLFLATLRLSNSSGLAVADHMIRDGDDLNVDLPRENVEAWMENLSWIERKEHRTREEKKLDPYRIIDAAAQRGNLPLLTFLLGKGARCTERTLPIAVYSGSRLLIQHLIEGTTAYRADHGLYTKYAATYGDLRQSFTEVFNAAARTGDFWLVEQLRQQRVYFTHRTLASAVVSRSYDLVRYLIQESNDIAEYSEKVVDAITSTSVEILALLETLPAFEIASREQRKVLAIQTASREGDLSLIHDLLGELKIVYDRYGSNSRKRNTILAHSLLPLLIEAIESGWTEIAQALIDGGSCVGSSLCLQDCTCRKSLPHVEVERPQVTPLIAALEMRNAVLVEALLDAGAAPCLAGITLNWHRPLYLAITWGNESVVRSLLYAGAVINASWGPDRQLTRSNNRRSHLAVAVSSGNRDLVTLLLEKGADPNGLANLPTPIETAARNGDQVIFNLLLGYGASAANSMALFKAVQENEQDAVEMLLQAFAFYYPQGKPGFGNLAFKSAIKNGHLDLVDRLIRHKVGTYYPGGTFDDEDVVGDYIIPRSEDEFDIEDSFRSVLGSAMEVPGPSSEVIMVHLLQAKADPNGIVAYEGIQIERRTALLWAIELDNFRAMEILISYGADVNWPATTGLEKTPLQYASELGNMRAVQLLLSHGADTNGLPAVRFGATALQFAAIGGFGGIVELLIDNDAEVNGPTAKINGRSAVSGAAEHGRLHMVEFLLYHGAKIDPTGVGDRCEAIVLAEKNGHLAVAQLLRSHLDSLPRLHHSSQMRNLGLRNDTSEPYMCKSCNTAFATNFTLKRHLREKHHTEEDTGSELHTCGTCDRNFLRPDDFKRHLATHTKQGYMTCPTCQRKFRKDYYNKHHLGANGQCKRKRSSGSK